MNQVINSNKDIVLLLYILFLAPLGIYLQEMSFADSNAYGALYTMLVTMLCLVQHRKDVTVNSRCKPLFVFILLITVASFFSGAYLYALQTIMVFVFIFWGGCNNLLAVSHYIKIISWVGVVIGLSCVLELLDFGLYTSIIQVLFKTEVNENITRLYMGMDMCGFMPQTSHTAGIIVFSIYTWIFFWAHKRRVFRFAMIGVLLVGLFLTAKRAHIVFGSVALLVSYFIGFSGAKRIKKILGIGAIAIAALYVLFEIVAPILDEENVISEIQYTIENINDQDEDVTHGRRELQNAAFDMIQTSPIWGHGWGSFKNTVAYRGGSTDAHNVYLQLFAEMGGIVCFLFMISIWLVLMETVRILKKCNQKPVFSPYIHFMQFSFSIQAFFIAYCFTGNCLYNIDFWAMYGFAVALLVSVKRKVYE